MIKEILQRLTVQKQPRNSTENGAFEIIDVSRKYRIKQNNDDPANKPPFHTVFQDAAQPFHKHFSTRVAAANLPYAAGTALCVSGSSFLQYLNL